MSVGTTHDPRLVSKRSRSAVVDRPKKRRKRKPKKLPVFLTERERELVIDAAREVAPRGVPNGQQRNAAIIAVFVFAGLRVAELAHLDRADVDLDELLLQVREGKGRKDRVVPLHPRAAVALEEYLAARSDDHQSAFLSRRGQRISVRAIRDLVTSTVRHAGVAKRISPHKLRHTFATHYLNKNPGRLLPLRDLLGHEDLSTTQIYTHVAVDGLREGMDF